MKTSTLQVDLRVALLYALFGGLWILLSDRLLAAFVTDVSLLTTMQTYKGWAYVAISALLIYSLLRREVALRKIAEEELRESEERYRLLFETSIDAFLLTTPDGGIQAANPAACRMFGWAEEEIKQIGRSGVVDKTDPRFSIALEERARDGNFRGELTFVRKDGTKFPGEISTAIFKDRQGNNKTSMVIRDITARVQTETALRDNEQRFRSIFEQSPIGIGVIDTLNHSFIQVNPKYCEIVGRTKDEMMNINFDMITHPDDIGKDKDELQKLINGDIRSYEFDKRYIRPDQSVIWAHLTIVAMWAHQDEPKIHLTMVEDITSSRQAEVALRESEERLQLFIEHAPAALAMFDQEMRYLAVSHRWMTDYSIGDQGIIGKSHYEIFPEISDEWKLVHQRGLAGEIVHADEDRFERLDGSIQWLRWEVRPWHTADGTIGGIVIFTEDVTARMQAEEALRESEEKYRLLFENVMNGFALHKIVLNDEGKPIDYIFLEVNDAFERLTGRKRENILGEKATRVIPGIQDDPVDWIGQYGEVALTGKDIRFEQNAQEIDKWYSILAFRPREGQFATIFEDITERKQAENELHRRIEELSALYQTTLDIISVQDLPDLLNTIVMRAIDLLEGTSGGLYLCDSEQKQARCVVSYKTPHDYTGTVLAYGEGAAGIVASTGKPLIIDDYQTWEGRAETFESAHPFSAVISVPMLWHGEVTGVIHVLHDTQKHKFTEDDLKLLTSFANQAAIVVENARLFEETQRRLDRLSALRRIDQVITSSLDLRVTLNILLGQIIQLLEVDAAAVLLYQPELHSLDFAAGQGFRAQTLQSTTLPLGKGFAGRAAKERRTIQVFDLEELRTGFLHTPEFRNEEFVAYIGVPLIAKGNIIGVLEIYNRQQFVPDEEWMDFLETLAGQAAIAIDNINLFNNLEKSNLGLIQAYDATIEGWARALELRDMETEGHSRRVVDMTIELARQLGIEESQLVHVRQGALLHDIGKMGVPDSILQKSGPLTDEEWEIIHQHPVYANKWLTPISYLKPALDIPYCHHERWDGSGYPRGLMGEQIPLAARIFTVVDVWDALRSDRPYRKKWSKERTREYILELSGKHFDPDVVEAFLALIDSEERE